MKNIILIDYENIQVKNLDLLYELDTEIYVFTGPTQKNYNRELVQSAQKFGSRIEWISMSCPGNNALDFHIAFYLGKMCVDSPKAYFHIISKDKGFDALVAFMKNKNLFVDRVTSIEDISLIKKKKEIEKDPVAFVKNSLQSQTKPAKFKTLQNSIKSWLKIDDADKIIKIIDSLRKEGTLTIDEKGKVEYH